MKRAFFGLVLCVVLFQTGCATVHVHNDRSGEATTAMYRPESDGPSLREAAADFTVKTISRVGSTTVRYKLSELSGDRPNASLKSTIEADLLTMVIDTTVHCVIDVLCEPRAPRRRSYRSE